MFRALALATRQLVRPYSEKATRNTKKIGALVPRNTVRAKKEQRIPEPRVNKANSLHEKRAEMSPVRGDHLAEEEAQLVQHLPKSTKKKIIAAETFRDMLDLESPELVDVGESVSRV
jgi:hypothetical protein